MSEDLTLFYAAVLLVGIFLYVLLDGFDLGIGILYPLAPTGDARTVMMNSVAPVWDGNETWLVLGGVGMLAAFPLAYSVLLSAFYVPLSIMLIALILRGVAFEFRIKAAGERKYWSAAFFLGSACAAFMQGAVLGAFLDGVTVVDRAFAGGPFDWLTWFSAFTGLGVMAGYALLGATWLIMKAEGALQDWVYRITPSIVVVVALFMLAISLWTPLRYQAVAERWFSFPNILLLGWVPIACALALWRLWEGLARKEELSPFPLTALLFLLGFLGLIISLWPYAIPPSTTIWQAAAPAESQRFLLFGFVVLLPVVVIYTIYSYYVFRGKSSLADGYH